MFDFVGCTSQMSTCSTIKVIIQPKAHRENGIEISSNTNLLNISADAMLGNTSYYLNLAKLVLRLNNACL